MSAEIKSFIKSSWKEGAVLAVAAALLFEVGCNIFTRHTIWHRIENLEGQVKSLEHTRELEELRTHQRLDDLQQESDTNKEDLKEVEKQVKRK